LLLLSLYKACSFLAGIKLQVRCFSTSIAKRLCKEGPRSSKKSPLPWNLEATEKSSANLICNWSNEAGKGLYLLGCLEDVENCLATPSSVATQAKVDKNDTTPQLPRGCRKVPPLSQLP
jgi:hypothetical protein